MRALRILATAFLGGVILASCGRIVEPCARRLVVRDSIPALDAHGDTASWVVVPARSICVEAE